MWEKEHLAKENDGLLLGLWELTSWIKLKTSYTEGIFGSFIVNNVLTRIPSIKLTSDYCVISVFFNNIFEKINLTSSSNFLKLISLHSLPLPSPLFVCSFIRLALIFINTWATLCACASGLALCLHRKSMVFSFIQLGGPTSLCFMQ